MKTRSVAIAVAFISAASMLSPPVLGVWSVERETDSMTGKENIEASVSSDNQVLFKFPHGATKGHLVARNHPRYGKNIYFYVDKGHILCHTTDPCTILIKFDDGAPIKFRGGKPSDGSITTVFILGFDKFAKLASKSKRAIIEVEFYQNGAPEFVFDISGFPTEELKLAAKAKK